MNSSALDHIQIVLYEIDPAHLSLSISELGNQYFHYHRFHFLVTAVQKDKTFFKIYCQTFIFRQIRRKVNNSLLFNNIVLLSLLILKMKITVISIIILN